MKRRAMKVILIASLVIGTMAVPPAVHAFKVIPPGQSLIIMNRPHSDVNKFRERLKKRGLVIVNELRCKTEEFSVFEVQPRSGGVKAALAGIQSSGDVDLEGAEVKFKSGAAACDPHIGDTSFASQSNLQRINFSEMYCLLDSMGLSQVVQPRLTIIDLGCATIAGEMLDVTQYNFAGGANGTVEAPIDNGVHGTAVCSVAASITDNDDKIAGVASHAQKPVKVVSCRVSADGTNADTVDVMSAMIWCIDHPELRGGPGSINLSVNSFGLPKYNGSSVFQGIAKAAKKQKSLFVNAAGNEGLYDPSKEKNFRRIANLDESDQLYVATPPDNDSSNFGPFKGAAPGVLIPVWDKSTNLVQFGRGTSYSTPHWAGAISLLMSLDPKQKLNAVTADKIIEKTGTKTSQGYVKPDLRAAVIKALKLKP